MHMPLSLIQLAGSEELTALNDTVPLETSPVPTPDIFNMQSDDSVQSTLSDILHAVHKCTASVDDLKERFGGLKETVSLLC